MIPLTTCYVYSSLFSSKDTFHLIFILILFLAHGNTVQRIETRIRTLYFILSIYFSCSEMLGGRMDG
ncbi:hypothetical protein V8F20_000944 [Naviculisporaceae sp. PSN 640]